MYKLKSLIFHRLGKEKNAMKVWNKHLEFSEISKLDPSPPSDALIPFTLKIPIIVDEFPPGHPIISKLTRSNSTAI
jgi:hypothetical protein